VSTDSGGGGVFQSLLAWVAQKFAEKVQTMAAAEVKLKSPFVPGLYTPFSKGEFLLGILTPLRKT
jgi:hypothetical protein